MYSVIGFGLASFLLIAVYMFLNGQQHSQLPRCWLFEPDDNGTCDKLTGALGSCGSGNVQQKRAAIRESWGSDRRLHRVMFFSAKPVDEAVFDELRREAAQKGDIVVLPGIFEHYDNITHQTLEILRAASMDPVATHTLKVDDDSYVHVNTLMTVMARVPQRRLFMGHIDRESGGPHREPSSQWYVTKEEWPTEKYPYWAHGAGYVLSKDLVREVASGAALKTNNHRIFKLEDVAMGSWIEYIAKEKGWAVQYISHSGFNFMGCSPSDVVSHYIKPEQARCMHAHGDKTCCTHMRSRRHRKGYFLSLLL
ncbi:hypothetical protein WJX75_006091 [Coccomyxa subellipsoidea]|uniref:Hexosyltransferase n=1 Tax=Coccomyxa subellipsoidea TaxID=248742 RepID=A0ABR2YCC6_9CHLO